ncbi:MAG: FK506-binding protein 1B [Cirrosporium novae-zelandiae]|nr:MAG: FK506-binding protein 1B [Cirrosporium novae-zelandiae]
MGVTRKVIKEGNGVDHPQKGDLVGMEYTGYLHDEAAAANEYKGKKFDSSEGRGLFETPIGVGKVIRGWDEGVVQMTLGEKATLTISGDYAYGNRGFPNLIPPNATLIFVVELKKINAKSV